MRAKLIYVNVSFISGRVRKTTYSNYSDFKVVSSQQHYSTLFIHK